MNNTEKHEKNTYQNRHPLIFEMEKNQFHFVFKEQNLVIISKLTNSKKDQNIENFTHRMCEI